MSTFHVRLMVIFKMQSKYVTPVSRIRHRIGAKIVQEKKPVSRARYKGFSPMSDSATLQHLFLTTTSGAY